MSLRRPSLRTLGVVQLVAIIVLAISVGILAYFAITTQYALCAFKGDLEGRLAANRAILATETDPIIRAYGLRIPRSVVASNARSQQATLDSLDSLYC